VIQENTEVFAKPRRRGILPRQKEDVTLLFQTRRDAASTTRIRGLTAAVVLLALALSAGAAENIFSVSPYVQHPATNAMSILFFTTKSCAATVKCWRADEKGETNELTTACEDVSTVLGKNPSDSSDAPSFSEQYKHRVRFENLRTHTDYRYEVRLGGAAAGGSGSTGDGGDAVLPLPQGQAYTNVFRTLPDRNTPVRFIGICDTETVPLKGKTDDSTEWSNNGGVSRYFITRREGFASNIVHIASRKPDLVTISGDLVAKGGYQENWDEFWRQNAGEYNDPAGSIPILAAIGNHDLKEGSTVSASGGGENPLKKFLTYFEFNSNGVRYAYCDGTTTAETRDTSQLFHREDLGPVTLIFLDTNKGDNDDYTKSTQYASSSSPAKRPRCAHRTSIRDPFSIHGSRTTWRMRSGIRASRSSSTTIVPIPSASTTGVRARDTRTATIRRTRIRTVNAPSRCAS